MNKRQAETVGRKRIVRSSLLLAVLLVLGLSGSPEPTAISAGELIGGLLQQNLDLPYNAEGAASEEEEDAPEIVYFYGQNYEASAVVYSLDESGSMTSNNRWALQSREVTRSISDLTDDSEFGVVYYGSRVSEFRNTPLKAEQSSKTAGIAWVRSRRPQGDTCIAEGTVRALQIVRRSASNFKAVIVTSDGHPDVCATGNGARGAEIARLIQMTLAANPGLMVKVHTVWVGQGSDREAQRFMRQLAEAHGGTFRAVSQ